MAIPLPKTVPDTPAGGNVLASMNAINTNRKLQLKNAYQELLNKFYPQQTQAAIDYTKALTSGVPSEIALRQAQAGLAGSASSINKWKLQNPSSLYTDPTLALLAYTRGQQENNPQQPNNTQAGNSPFAQNPINNIPSGGNQNAMNNLPQQQGVPQNSMNNIPNGGSSNPLTSYYGIQLPPTPSYTGNSFVDSRLAKQFQTPQQEAQLNLAKDQIQDQYNQYQKGLEEANQASIAANSMNQNFARYNQAMDKSLFKGTYGSMPTSGLAAVVPSLFHDFSPEQIADNAAKNIQQYMIPQLQAQMKNARFTNVDMQFVDDVKVNRKLLDNSREEISQYFTGVDDRMKQYNKFLTKASDPKTGLTYGQAQNLWSDLQDQLPVYNSKDKKINKYADNVWQLYLTPSAIDSVKKTGTYNLNDDIEYTAKKYKITPDKVRKQLGIQ